MWLNFKIILNFQFARLPIPEVASLNVLFYWVETLLPVDLKLGLAESRNLHYHVEGLGMSPALTLAPAPDRLPGWWGLPGSIEVCHAKGSPGLLPCPACAVTVCFF